MDEWKKLNNCTIFWWIAALGLGLAAFSAISGFIGVIMGIAVFVLIGLAGSRYFCVGSSSGVNSDVSFTRPAVGSDTPAIAAAAARAAIQNVTQHGPPSALATGAAPNGGKAPEAAPKPAMSKPEATQPASAKPSAPAPAAESAEPEAGTKPELLSAAREGGPDDLKLIKGVGPKLERELHEKGVYHFDQIAGWSDAEIAWADENLVRFKGRVSRDGWRDQARILASGGETEFSKRADKANGT